MGLLDILSGVGDLAVNAGRIIAAPVGVVVEAAVQVTKPVAEAVEEFCDEVTEAIKD